MEGMEGMEGIIDKLEPIGREAVAQVVALGWIQCYAGIGFAVVAIAAFFIMWHYGTKWDNSSEDEYREITIMLGAVFLMCGIVAVGFLGAGIPKIVAPIIELMPK